MRVNITYSVELDDVPNEVSRILGECEQSLRSIHGELGHTIDKDPLTIVEKLNKIRINLAKLDLKLGDSMDILSGYVQAASARPEAEQAAIHKQERLAALAAQLEGEEDEEL